MKIVAIMGSPRGMQGFTGSLLTPLLTAAEEAGAKTEILSLDTLTVQPCKGCINICHIQGKCHLEDDFGRILNGMLAADGIVFAVPNYMFGVTAQLKAVLDRCSLPLHCMRFYGKYAATVVTCGGSDPEDVELYLNKILTQYALRIVGGVNGVELQFADPDENVRLMQSAADLGRRLVTAIEKREVIPEQEQQIQQAFEIMAYLVQIKQVKWSVAFEYWKTNWKQHIAETSP
jgi:multimeric flavodoxin WrbA